MAAPASRLQGSQPGRDGALIGHGAHVLVGQLGLWIAAAQQVEPLLEAAGALARLQVVAHQLPERCQLRQPGRIGRRLKKTGDKKLERILRHSVQRTERRLNTLLAKADLGSVGLGKQHEARLAAKRLRYQAELYADWLDDDRLASHLPVCKALQETLGDLRDLALLAQHVGHDPASQLAQALASRDTYQQALSLQQAKVNDPQLTPSARVLAELQSTGETQRLGKCVPRQHPSQCPR